MGEHCKMWILSCRIPLSKYAARFRTWKCGCCTMCVQISIGDLMCQELKELERIIAERDGGQATKRWYDIIERILRSTGQGKPKGDFETKYFGNILWGWLGPGLIKMRSRLGTQWMQFFWLTRQNPFFSWKKCSILLFRWNWGSFT